MKPASRKMILWVLRLILASGRTPTIELVNKLKSMTQDEIKPVVSRAQSGRDQYFRETRHKLEDWGDLHGPAEACYRGDIASAMAALAGKPQRIARVVPAPARLDSDLVPQASPNVYADASPF